MIKINNDGFSKTLAEYKKHSENKIIPPIAPDLAVEFKLGKKYVYRLNTLHAGYEGIFKTQERLIHEFLSHIPISTVAKAYVPEKSYLDFLEPHKNNYYFVRLDLKNFFHSISIPLIKSNFKVYFENQFVDENKTQSLLDAFINLVTYTVPLDFKNETFSETCILPMGFKTSPVISNIIFRKLDILIEDYCSQHNIIYTRYADDMLFSSKTNNEAYKSQFEKIFNPQAKPKAGYIHSDRFLEEISYLVRIDGFKINKRKTIKEKHTLSLNGYTIEGSNYSDVQGSIRVSNKKTKIISQLIHEVNKENSSFSIMQKLFGFRVSHKYFNYLPAKPEHIERYCKDQMINKMTGYRSYMISLLKYDSKYKCIDKTSIKKYQTLIDGLESILSKSKFTS